MSLQQFKPCAYCDTTNPAYDSICIACGAPLGRPLQKPLDLTPKVTTTDQPAFWLDQGKAALEKDLATKENIHDAAQKAEKVYKAALGTYSVAWRTAAEAIVIALIGFIIGLIGGSTGMFFFGVVGAFALGITVGLTSKSFYATLIGAPAGGVIGLGISGVLWALSATPVIMVFVVTFFSIAGAVIGGRFQYSKGNFWEKTRPILGGLGGLAFGIAGAFSGWGIVSIVQKAFFP